MMDVDKWMWMMDWCRRKRINPASADNWERAEVAYLEDCERSEYLEYKVAQEDWMWK